MFVAIENNEMNVPQILDWINRTKNANNNVISPEFAMDILGKTNFYGHIKMVLKNIKENCKTKEDIEPYKEFILSCVDRREVSPQAMAVLQEMAKLCGCEEEFDEADKKVKIYNKTDCEKWYVIKNKLNLYGIQDEDVNVLLDCAEVSFEVNELAKVKKLRFIEGADVRFWGAEKIPEDVDFSSCRRVQIYNYDLSKIKNFHFREGSTVAFNKVQNIPDNLDVSMCDKVEFSDCDISRINKIELKEGGVITLYKLTVPKDFDFTKSSGVDVCSCYFTNIDEVSFREGADVSLRTSYEMPKIVDISMCKKADLWLWNLNDVKKLVLKNEEQLEEFGGADRSIYCEVVYKDEEKQKQLPLNKTMEL